MQTGLKLPARNSHSKGQSRVLVPHKLLFCLAEPQLKAVLIPAWPCASTSAPGCIPMAELLLPQDTAPSRTHYTQTLLGSWDRLLLIMAVLSVVAH